MVPSGEGSLLSLKSPLNKYLSVNQFGNVTCENEEKDDTTKFEVTIQADGRWAFKYANLNHISHDCYSEFSYRSKVRGYYLGAEPDGLICSAKTPGDAELWALHLAIRPQLNLRNIKRKR